MRSCEARFDRRTSAISAAELVVRIDECVRGVAPPVVGRVGDRVAGLVEGTPGVPSKGEGAAGPRSGRTADALEGRGGSEAPRRLRARSIASLAVWLRVMVGLLRGLRWGLLAEGGGPRRSRAAAAAAAAAAAEGLLVVGESDEAEAEAEEENVGVAMEAESLEETEAVVGAVVGAGCWATPLSDLAATPLDRSISTAVARLVRKERIVSIIVATP